MAGVGQCRGCGADILWALTEAGKRVPLDAKPEKRFIKADLSPQVRLVDTYLSHFVTCPDASKFPPERRW